jgi:hypothetical protein
MRVQSAIHIEHAVYTKQVKEDKLNLSVLCHHVVKDLVKERTCQQKNVSDDKERVSERLKKDEPR